ncbi:unnamed protein product [Leptosia nina]|uniref:DDE-1 domain-containing protein n=1 Tax=Leptosia nina TaxID=320188 RepID=A0AAV1JWZ7_9NEOP
MPNNTFISKSEKSAPGFKAAKDRVTLLLCSNACGDCLIKPLMLYRSFNPRALKNQNKDNLPVFWRANKKAGASKDSETNYTTLNLTTRARATKIRRAVTESRNLRSDLKQKILESTDELNNILKNIKEGAVGNKQCLPSPTLPTRRLDAETAPTPTATPSITIDHKILEHLKENKELIKQQTEELNKLKKEIKTNNQEIKHNESGKTIIEELNNMNKKRNRPKDNQYKFH